jgi:hypothetical protein
VQRGEVDNADHASGCASEAARMEYRVRVNLFSTALIVAIGVAASLVTSTVVASRAYRARGQEANQQNQVITVKGSARLPVRSDLGVWRIDVSGEAGELNEAFTLLEERVQRVRAFLEEAGFSGEEIALGAIDTSTHYKRDEHGRTTREVVSRTLSRQFTVTSSDVKRMAATAGEVTSLLKEGVPVRSSVPAFTYTKVGDLKIEVLGRASADARRRAEEIAARSGCRVAEVRQVRMGVIQITRPHSTAVSSMGIYDTSTIEKDISVVVTVTCRIED